MSDERSDKRNESRIRADEMSTEAILLQRSLAGQEAAFEALFREHYARIVSVLYRLVGDDADDLAQEVFMRLYQKPPRAADSDLGAWLYRVATNLGYNALRARKRWTSYRNLVARVVGGADWREAEPDPEAQATRADECRQVRLALAHLTKQQTSILVLRYSGLSYREIAAVVDVAPGSVGALLARAEASFEQAYRRIQEPQRQAGEGR
jgi:RNA polymerase sigma-70 factor, ECF subfamily